MIKISSIKQQKLSKRREQQNNLPSSLSFRTETAYSATKKIVGEKRPPKTHDNPTSNPAGLQANKPPSVPEAAQKRQIWEKKRGRGERVAEGNCITMTDVGGVPAQWHLLGDKNVGFPDFFFLQSKSDISWNGFHLSNFPLRSRKRQKMVEFSAF